MYNSEQMNYQIKFSNQELKDLFIAVGALTLMFTLMNINIFNLFLYFTLDNIVIFLFVIFECFVGAFTGFFLHELGHKFTAQKFGCWAEFRVNYSGLLLGLLFSLSGFFIFFVPGAVYIKGDIDLEKNGKISLMGPLTNLIIGGLSFGVYWLIRIFNLTYYFLFLYDLTYFVSTINISLALFNLLPFGPLDGKKIFNWNKSLLIFLLIGSIVLMILIYIF
ncbi:MAG: M50 family metallopeptidase [Candidatus Helarchaeota archaeon]